MTVQQISPIPQQIAAEPTQSIRTLIDAMVIDPTDRGVLVDALVKGVDIGAEAAKAVRRGNRKSAAAEAAAAARAESRKAGAVWWMQEPCPDWCLGDHRADDRYTAHNTELVRIQLPRDRPEENRPVPFLAVRLGLTSGFASPHIIVHPVTRSGMATLGASEARDLAVQLLRFADLADGVDVDVPGARGQRK